MGDQVKVFVEGKEIGKVESLDLNGDGLSGAFTVQSSDPNIFGLFGRSKKTDYSPGDVERAKADFLKRASQNTQKELEPLTDEKTDLDALLQEYARYGTPQIRWLDSYERQAQGSGGNQIDPLSYWTYPNPPNPPEPWASMMGIRRGEKVVAQAKFETLILTVGGKQTEVIWFEGEELPEVLERLAQALR